MNNANKPYFLLSFLPAAAYWYLETYYSLQVALIGGVLLGLIEMILEKKISGHVHAMSKLNLALIVVLGGVSLIAQEGIWFKLQPTFTGLALAGFLGFKKVRGQSLMFEMLQDLKQQPPFPKNVYQIMEWHMCLFLIGFALFMTHIAMNESTANWLFWKTGGFYAAFGGFMILEIIFLRWYLRRKLK